MFKNVSQKNVFKLLAQGSGKKILFERRWVVTVIEMDSGGSKNKDGMNMKLYSQQIRNDTHSKIQKVYNKYVSSNLHCMHFIES